MSALPCVMRKTSFSFMILKARKWFACAQARARLNQPFVQQKASALIAHLGESELTNLLAIPRQQRTPQTLTDETAIRDRLEMVRQNGYAVEDEESEEGTRCIAAPVRQADGGIVASIGLAGPRLRMKKRLFPSLIPQVTSVANQISRQMGYHH